MTSPRPLLWKGLAAVDWLGLAIGLLSLRLVLGWEFFEAGIEKLGGENWFTDIHDRFPFPFDLVPPAVSWQLATWFEILGGVALVFGVMTRFFSLSLVVLTVVAIASVHWPASWASASELLKGYVITDQGFGNFKLPVLYIGMLLPLLLMGPGRLSVDHVLRRKLEPQPVALRHHRSASAG